MMQRRPRLLLSLLVATAWTGCAPAPPPAAAPAVPKVVVSQPIAREVADYQDLTGRTDAASTVDIRARVTGYLLKVAFKDGDIVKEGDLLYQIDPRPLQETLDRANGEVERLHAQQRYLTIQVDRYTKLSEKQVISQQELDQYLAQQAENVGALKAAEAQVRQAKLNLDFARITSPLTGRVSRTQLTAGNLVVADTTLLTTVVSIDPMYAYFDVDEPTMLRVQKMLREGTIKPRALSEVRVRMGLADDVDRKFPLEGNLDFVNNTVDPQTGTIQLRGVFPNPYKMPDHRPLLTPGLFVRVRLHTGTPHRTLLVTERALGTDQGRKFVYVVDSDKKVRYRPVKPGLLFDGLQAIEEGLDAGQWVVVNGLQRVRPEIEVETTAVDMLSLASPGSGAKEPEGGQSPAAVPVSLPASKP